MFSVVTQPAKYGYWGPVTYTLDTITTLVYIYLKWTTDLQSVDLRSNPVPFLLHIPVPDHVIYRQPLCW